MQDVVWLPTDVEGRELAAFIESTDTIFQPKEDGKHVIAYRLGTPMVGTPGNVVRVTNRRGTETTFPEAIKELLMALAPGTTLEGELLHRGPFVVFDILDVDGVNVRPKSCRERLALLDDVFAALPPSPWLTKIESVATPEAKIALMQRLQAERAEGVILKNARAPYAFGKTGSMRRLKFRKRADVILAKRNDDKRSYEAFAYSDDGDLVNIGSVNAAGFWGELKAGEFAVAEVDYLYSTPDKRLFQPVIVSLGRDDKEPRECLVRQLVIGKRFNYASP